MCATGSILSPIWNSPDNFGVKHAGDTRSRYAPFVDCTKMQHYLIQLLKQNSTFIAPQKPYHTTESSGKWPAVSIYVKLVISHIIEKFLASCRCHVAMNKMRRWICTWLRKDGISIGTTIWARLVIHNIITTKDTPYLNNTGQKFFPYMFQSLSINSWKSTTVPNNFCRIMCVCVCVCVCCTRVKVGQPH